MFLVRLLSWSHITSSIILPLNGTNQRLSQMKAYLHRKSDEDKQGGRWK